MAKAPLFAISILIVFCGGASAQNVPPQQQSACNAIRVYRQTISNMQLAYARETNPIKKAELGPPIQAKANELYAAFQNSFPRYEISSFVGQVTGLDQGFGSVNIGVKLCDELNIFSGFGTPLAANSYVYAVLLEPFRSILRELAVGNTVTISGSVYPFDVDHKQLCVPTGVPCGPEVLRVKVTSLTKQ